MLNKTLETNFAQYSHTPFGRVKHYMNRVIAWQAYWAANGALPGTKDKIPMRSDHLLLGRQVTDLVEQLHRIVSRSDLRLKLA